MNKSLNSLLGYPEYVMKVGLAGRCGAAGRCSFRYCRSANSAVTSATTPGNNAIMFAPGQAVSVKSL